LFIETFLLQILLGNLRRLLSQSKTKVLRHELGEAECASARRTP
jgi:hypothetical protein